MTPWSLFAWQGISLKVPSDWEMGAADGDSASGHCRLDDSEYARLDIRWQPGRASSSAHAVADAYIRRAKLDRRGIQVKRDVRVVNVPGVDAEFFLVKGERESMHMAARCALCKRVAILRVVYDPEEKFRPVLQEMFASYCDHPVEGRVPWSLYGFRFDVPQEWKLFDNSLRAGRLQFEFRGRNRVIHVVRSSLAETWLKKKSLTDWAQTDKALDACARKAEINSPGAVTPDDPSLRSLRLCGAPPPVSWTAREPRSIRRLLFRRRLIRGAAWHCPEANSLVGARWMGPDSAAGELDALVASIRCHERSAE